VHHDVDLLLAQNAADKRFITQIAVVQFHLGCDGSAVSVHQVIEHDRAMTRRDELANTVTADVTGTSNDEYVHKYASG
jgi:hypothetical protein